MNPDNGGFGPMMNRQFFVDRAHEHSGHPLGWLFLFVVVALVVALVVWLVLRMMGARTAPAGPALAGSAFAGSSLDDALDAARMRYAEGKIDRKEFLRITGDLSASTSPGR
jgi:uncharacterized membrane protein